MTVKPFIFIMLQTELSGASLDLSLCTCVRVSQEKIPALVAGSRVCTYLTFWSAFPSVWIRNLFSSYLPHRSCDRILIMNDLLLSSDLPLFQILVRLSIFKKNFFWPRSSSSMNFLMSILTGLLFLVCENFLVCWI